MGTRASASALRMARMLHPISAASSCREACSAGSAGAADPRRPARGIGDVWDVSGRWAGCRRPAVFPLATVQTCVIHLIRGTFRYASKRYWEALAKDLRPIYTAPSAEAAWAAF